MASDVIAISLPDQLLNELDRLARSSGRSLIGLVNAALADYMAPHDLYVVTEAMSRVCVDIGDHPDTLVADAGRHVFSEVSAPSSR
jgi:metal-responsive CopG/Arc/MetJ family transcriptional regulator